jgi:3-deoxy-D-arabino-heptulosonate 7-phosphate (DAHP) synthase class II
MLVSGDHPAFAFLQTPEATAARADELDQQAARHRKMGHERLARGYERAAQRLRQRLAPELGLRPSFIWRMQFVVDPPRVDDMRERLAEVDEAITRYRACGMAVPIDWRREALDLAQRISGWEAIACQPT